MAFLARLQFSSLTNGPLNNRMRLLLVEDEPSLARHLARGLAEAGYATDVAHTCASAHELVEGVEYDLVLLDQLLPDGHGVFLLREWRANDLGFPVLILTARDSTEEKVRGLDAGADDYLTKPFDFDELLARVRTLLRRSTAPPLSELTIGNLTVKRSARSASRGGKRLNLTPKEFELLEYFALHAGTVLSRERIGEHVWDHTYDARTNTIDVIVSRLRRKLEADGDPRLIHTEAGVGYLLREED